jgi:plastocyanin
MPIDDQIRHASLTGDILPTHSYARVFDVPGLYIYFCVHHEREGMVGRVAVSP